MTTLYRVNLKQITTGFVDVDADNEQQAKEVALAGGGEFCGSLDQYVEVVSVRQLDNQHD